MVGMYRKKISAVGLTGLILVLIGCSVSVKGTEVPAPIVRPYELLTFGNFEDIEQGEDGFPEGHRHIGLNKGDVFVDDSISRSGEHSLYIEGTGGSQANGFGVETSATRPLEGGETYKLTVWFRAPKALELGQGQNIYARISTGSTSIHWDEEWFEPLEPGSQYKLALSNHLLYIRALSTARQDSNDPNDWHPLSVTFTVPPGANLGGVVNVYNDSDQPLWIDDLSLQLM